jgi:pimeloyl-ACP methyl ester carboxylesterase
MMSDGFRLKRLSVLAVLLAALWTSTALAAAHEDVYFDVSVGGTSTARIHADVYNNPQNRGSVTILAVHGLTEIGSMYAPLANAIYTNATLGPIVKRIVSIDMIAHGESSPPAPVSQLFSSLTIQDNASVLIQSIDKLRALNKGPQIVMGHSMGGLAIQTSQELLLTQSSSLAKHGVFGAILLSSVPNAGVEWTQPPPNPNIGNYIRPDAVLGVILDVPPDVAPFTGAFTTLSGALVPNVQSLVQTFVANDWSGPEPITTVVQLTGENPRTRPFVRPNAFALRNGTVLTVLSFSQDVLTPAVDQDNLYTYLTGISSTGSATLYRPIATPDAVHSMFISNPAGLLTALKNGVIHAW